MKTRLFLLFSIAAIGFLSTPSAWTWGRTGHAMIGQAALAQLEPAKRARAADILGVSAAAGLPAAIEEACFWPDIVRESPRWAWSAPLHFVNIPRSSTQFDRQRDCPDGRCAPEAILKYAAELSRPHLDRESRWQAFAWLCHLVGDLHQPLHAGFRDDRGGNLVEIDFRGQRYNLHEFWDRTLANDRLAGYGQSAFHFEPWLESPVAGRWAPVEVVTWTEESHALAAARAYPPGPVIEDEFADHSWTIIRQQWGKAAVRLARVLDDVLAEEVASAPD